MREHPHNDRNEHTTGNNNTYARCSVRTAFRAYHIVCKHGWNIDWIHGLQRDLESFRGRYISSAGKTTSGLRGYFSSKITCSVVTRQGCGKCVCGLETFGR